MYVENNDFSSAYWYGGRGLGWGSYAKFFFYYKFTQIDISPGHTTNIKFHGCLEFFLFCFGG